MRRNNLRTLGIREIPRWWPLLVVPALIAVGATMWSLDRQEPSYTVTTKLMVVPLAQWDETFIGTSMVRDSGDASITAGTIAAHLDTYEAAAVAADFLGGDWTAEAIDAGVKVTAVDNSNIVDIEATAADPDIAVKLAEEFAQAALADRWRTLSAELDARIAAMGPLAAARPDAHDAATRLDTLKLIRQGGVDPTLRIDSTSPVMRHDPLPIGAAIGIATVGGLFIGLLAEFAIVRLRRRTDSTGDEPTVDEPAVDEPAAVEQAVVEPTDEEPAIDEPAAVEQTVVEPTDQHIHVYSSNGKG
jgi:hypothetical protein